MKQRACVEQDGHVALKAACASHDPTAAALGAKPSWRCGVLRNYSQCDQPRGTGAAVKFLAAGTREEGATLLPKGTKAEMGDVCPPARLELSKSLQMH